MRLIVAVSLALATSALIVALALAPLHGSYDAAGCRRAYARARSLADTARVDLHRYRAGQDRVKHTCGEVRVRAVAVELLQGQAPQSGR